MKPSGDRRGANRGDDLAADHEEAAHRIADRRSRQQAEEPGAEFAELLARRRQAARRASGRRRACRSPVRPAPATSAAYICGRIVSSCCRSPSITATKSALEASQPSITAPARPSRLTRRMQRRRGSRARDGEGDVGGAVGRIVVDDDHFPRQAVERRLQPLEQRRHVGRFAIGRNDDGEGRPHVRRRRIGCHLALARGRARFARRPQRAIRQGKGARQAARRDDRQRDFVAPAAPQRHLLRRVEGGEIGRKLRLGRLAPAPATTIAAVAADEVGAVGEEARCRADRRKRRRSACPARAPGRSCRRPSIWSRRRRRRVGRRRLRAMRPSRAFRASGRPRLGSREMSARREAGRRLAERRRRRARRAAPPRRSPMPSSSSAAARGLGEPGAEQRIDEQPAGHRPVRQSLRAPQRRQGEDDDRRQREADEKQAPLVARRAPQRRRSARRPAAQRSTATETRSRRSPSRRPAPAASRPPPRRARPGSANETQSWRAFQTNTGATIAEREQRRQIGRGMREPVALARARARRRRRLRAPEGRRCISTGRRARATGRPASHRPKAARGDGASKNSRASVAAAPASAKSSAAVGHHPGPGRSEEERRQVEREERDQAGARAEQAARQRERQPARRGEQRRRTAGASPRLRRARARRNGRSIDAAADDRNRRDRAGARRRSCRTSSEPRPSAAAKASRASAKTAISASAGRPPSPSRPGLPLAKFTKPLALARLRRRE